MLERFTNNDQPNIKELVAENERTYEAPFDPRRDISEAGWEAMLNVLQQVRSQNSYVDLLHLAAQLHKLDPTREYLSDNDWVKIERRLDQKTRAADQNLLTDTNKAKMLAHIRVLKPDSPPPSPEQHTHMVNLLNVRRNQTQWRTFLQLATILRELSPGHQSYVTPEDRENIFEEIEMQRKPAGNRSNLLYLWHDYSQAVGKENTHIPDEDWQKILEYIQSAKVDGSEWNWMKLVQAVKQIDPSRIVLSKDDWKFLRRLIEDVDMSPASLINTASNLQDIAQYEHVPTEETSPSMPEERSF